MKTTARKRILCWVLALAMTLGCCLTLSSLGLAQTAQTAQPAQVLDSAPPQSEGVYQLSSSDDLVWFAEQVNAGQATLSGAMTDDIALTGIWTPIGSAAVPFAGHFDGQGHAISGLTIQGTLDNQGLFGSIATGGRVQSVTVRGSIAGGIAVGGIAGSNQGSISECTNEATILATGYWVGGIAGDNAGTASISDCTNAGAVTSTNSDGRIGGITGRCEGDVDVVRCVNNGSVTGVKQVGGIVGASYYSQTGTPSVLYCVNNGDITDTLSGSKSSTAGIVGRNNGGIVGWCYNTGTIDANNRVGGIVGAHFTESGQYPLIHDCYNVGNVKARYQGDGAIVGEAEGPVTNCYFLDGSEWQNEGIGIDEYGNEQPIVLTAEAMRAAEFPTLLDDTGEIFVADANNINDGYPVLSWQAPTPVVENYAVAVDPATDGIWTVAPDATQAPAGQVVNVTVNKAIPAETTHLTGLTVTAADGSIVSVTTVQVSDAVGSFSFVMPAQDVTLAVTAEYDALEVYVQTGKDQPILAKSYTRADMLARANDNVLHYTGYDRFPTPVVGIARQGVALSTLLADANIPFASGDKMEIYATDSMGYAYNTLTYDFLYGDTRYYYPNIFTGATTEEKAADKVEYSPTLVIQGYQSRYIDLPAGQTIDDMPADTLNTYRFTFGMTEEDFNAGTPDVNHAKVNLFVKYTCKLVFQLAEPYTPPLVDGVYQLSDQRDLEWLAKQVKEGATDIQAALTQDVSLSGNWTPIGSASVPFAGSFDGKGRTVSGLSIVGSLSDQGLFGVIAATGSVKDVTVQGSITGANCIGSIAGQNLGCISGCTANVTILASGSVIGGIAGDNAGAAASIVGCKNIGSITSTSEDGRVGGIAGRCEGSVGIAYSKNDGAITGVKYVGGIAGGSFHTAIATPTVQNCVNTGVIKDTLSGSKSSTGGIIGRNCGGVVQSCYNTGSVDGNNRVGGIVGANFSELGQLPEIRDCYNVGTVAARYQADGAIAGENEGTIQNCHFLIGCEPRNEGVGVEEGTSDIQIQTAEALRTAAFVNALNQNTVAYNLDSDNINDGLPVLLWQGGTPPSSKYAISAAADLDRTTWNVEAKQTDDANWANESVWNSGTLPANIDTAQPGDTVKMRVGYIYFDGKRGYPELAEFALAKLTGVTLTDAAGNAVNFELVAADADGRYAFLTFTMPASDVTVDVQAQIETFDVYVRVGTGSQELVHSYTREEMLALASRDTLIYTGYDSLPTAVGSRADAYVTLPDLIADAQQYNAAVKFEADCKLTPYPMDGMGYPAYTFTYEELYGETRYSYPNIAQGSAEGQVEVQPAFVITGVQSRYINLDEGQTLYDLPAESLNAYRFVFGQTQTQFNNGVPDIGQCTLNHFYKWVNKIVITVPEDYMLGDVDGNGIIQSRDALLALRIATGSLQPTAAQEKAADVNKSGEVTSLDALTILRWATTGTQNS